MADTVLRIKRRLSGATGAPAGLKSAEPAYNMADDILYIGFGDDGAGNATSIKPFAKADFDVKQRVPTGGTSGQVLTVDGSGNVVWGAAPQNGTTYTAGTGITITGSSIAADTSVVATVTNLNLKAPLASPALTGTPTAPTASGGTNTTQVATTAFVTTAVSSKANTASPTFTGTVTVPTLAVTTAATVPTLAAGTSTTGAASTAFVQNALTNLAASAITSGTFDVARIPVLPSQTVQVSSGDLSALTTAQQNAIAQGTVVTTTDGNRYVYNTGTKTLAASYIQLADITPDWSAISNKPTFSLVATTGAYGDLSGVPVLAAVATTGAYSSLSGLPALGTMAAQNANAVAITGGSITGVILDGGTF